VGYPVKIITTVIVVARRIITDKIKRHKGKKTGEIEK